MALMYSAMPRKRGRFGIIQTTLLCDMSLKEQNKVTWMKLTSITCPWPSLREDVSTKLCARIPFSVILLLNGVAAYAGTKLSSRYYVAPRMCRRRASVGMLIHTSVRNATYPYAWNVGVCLSVDKRYPKRWPTTISFRICTGILLRTR